MMAFYSGHRRKERVETSFSIQSTVSENYILSPLEHLDPDLFSSTPKSLFALLQVAESSAPPNAEIPVFSLNPKGSFFCLQA